MDGQTAAFVFGPYFSAHLFYQRAGNRQSQTCGFSGGVHCVKSVEESSDFDFIQAGSRIGKDDFTGFVQDDLQISLAVFDCVTQEIGENPGEGGPVKPAEDLLIGELYYRRYGMLL